MTKQVSIERLVEILKTVNPKTVTEIIIKEIPLDSSNEIAEIEVQIGSNTYILDCIKNNLYSDPENCASKYIEILDNVLNEIEIGYIWIDIHGNKKIKDTINRVIETDQDPINEIIRFQKDRLLDKQLFVFKTEILNILEELVEMTGEESNAARKIAEEIFEKYFKDKLIADSEHLVDSFCDIIVFSVGSLLKLGYKPKCALLETATEINSRVGKIIDGKFVKDKSPEAMAKWYKADYSKCKRD